MSRNKLRSARGQKKYPIKTMGKNAKMKVIELKTIAVLYHSNGLETVFTKALECDCC